MFAPASLGALIYNTTCLYIGKIKYGGLFHKKATGIKWTDTVQLDKGDFDGYSKYNTNDLPSVAIDKHNNVLISNRITGERNFLKNQVTGVYAGKIDRKGHFIWKSHCCKISVTDGGDMCFMPDGTVQYIGYGYCGNAVLIKPDYDTTTEEISKLYDTKDYIYNGELKNCTDYASVCYVPNQGEDSFWASTTKWKGRDVEGELYLFKIQDGKDELMYKLGEGPVVDGYGSGIAYADHHLFVTYRTTTDRVHYKTQLLIFQNLNSHNL